MGGPERAPPLGWAEKRGVINRVPTKKKKRPRRRRTNAD